MILQEVPQIVLVASGKGGVGKTTVASDIARQATEHVESVGFIDADISTPNSLQVIGGEEVDISNERLASSDSLVPPEVDGVQLVSQGLVLPDDVPVLRGAEWRAEAVADYIQNVEWDDGTEVIVIDSPPGSGEELQVVASAVPLDYAYVVSTPHPSAVRDATKTHEFFKQANVPHSGVLNMSEITAGDIVDHATAGANFTDIDGVGDATDERIREVLSASTENYPLFGYDDDGLPDFGTEIEAVLPYTESFERRRAAWGTVVRDLLQREEVAA
jgi:ATP-binding protein involved in chromosome partitioning